MRTPRRLLNILWHSNATWQPTGYGTQTKTWTHTLADLGYGVVVSAYRGLEGSPLGDSHGIVHLPRIKEQHSNDAIYAHTLFAPNYFPNHQPTDLVFSLIDVFAMEANLWRPLPWAAWTPIDCEPVLQHERVQFAACRWPLAMSRHGEAQMKDIGLKPIYIPHGIDTNVFSPIDRTLARQNMLKNNLITRPIPDDAFLVIVVGNNGDSPRKNFSGMFEAFQYFAKDHPDALMYVHADPSGVHGQPLDAMVDQLDIADKVIFPGPTLPMSEDGSGSLRSVGAYMMTTGLVTDEHLRDVYSAADVKLMLSMGEGFGLTDVESQACGCPIVGTKFSASIEMNFTGWLVNGIKFQRVPRSYQMLANSEEAALRLADAYDVWKAGNMPQLRERTRQAALAYDVQVVLDDYFIPALDQIGDELEAEPHPEWFKRQMQQKGVDLTKAKGTITEPVWDKETLKKMMAETNKEK